MKKVRLVVTGLLVCLVMGSLAMAQASEGFDRYRIERGDCLTEIAIRLPDVSSSNMLWVAQGIAKINNIPNPNEIKAWNHIYIPDSAEVLRRALEANLVILPEKRAGPIEKLQTKVSQLEWILGEQGLAFERLQKEKEEKEESRAMLADEVDKLEDTNFWYRRLLLLAGLLMVVLVVVLGVAIKAEVKLRKDKDQTEKEKQIIEQKVKELQEFIPGNSIKIKATKDGKKVEKDCKITEVHLTEGKLRRQLKCPYCGIKIWENNMPGHWEVCKKGPFPKPKK